MTTPTIQLMQQHRSIRQFTEEPIPPVQLDNIIRAMQAAATSSFQQCVTLIQVDDQDKRKALAQWANDQAHIITAAKFFVFCADYHRHLQVAPEGKVGYTEQLLTAAIDAGLMAQNGLLAAQSYGLGGVYIGAIRNQPTKVCQLLTLPQQVFPLFGLCLGHPAELPELKPRLPQTLFLHHDRYQPLNTKKLANYDQQVAAYYATRSSNTKATTWSTQVGIKLSQESRPFMRVLPQS